MKQVLYVTSNPDKFRRAQVNIEPHGIQLVHEPFEMVELQSHDGAEIALHKVQQAYDHFRKPVLVNDDTWSIPALNGFPSTGMKLCNVHLSAEDWLRLMHGKEDRRIFIVSHFAYHNGTKATSVQGQHERRILNAPQGSHHMSSILQVVAELDSDLSLAEEIERGRRSESANEAFWAELAQHIKQQ